jgi:hypothetical protein
MSLEMEKAVQSLVLTVDLKSPALLFSCKISRDVALTTYTQCFELGCGRKVRFDPARDALFLSTICQSWLQPLPGMQQSPESVPDYKGWFTGVTKLTLGASLVSALVMRGDLSFGWFLSHFQSLETLILLANEADHTVSLLKMREEVQFNGLGETLAKRYADQTDVRRADLISAHSQRWALLGELLKMEIEDYHIHNSSPAGWKCPEIEAMYLDTSSPLGRS